MPDLVPVKNVLVSVSDRTGLAELCAGTSGGAVAWAGVVCAGACVAFTV